MDTERLPHGLAEQIAQVDDATARLLARLSSLAAADAARPSLCAGWTVGHVLTHLARNADGLRRSAEGARRGERLAMYDSLQARSDDIQAGAARPTAQLTADVAASAAALRDGWSAMRAADWEREMPHHRGPRPLSDTPMMRLSEVEIHHVDLDCGYRPDGWPGWFVAHVLSSAATRLPARLPAGVRVDVRATDAGGHWSAGTQWSAGAEGAPVTDIRGPAWAVAAWLAGRPRPVTAALAVTGGELPELAPWP
jgi:maleylpyruvate isomerase